MLQRTCGVLILMGVTAAASAQSPSPAASAPPAQTEADEYTRYELLGPGTGRFHILYEVTATTPGATVFFNPIRKGSLATDERVRDRLNGKLLDFSIVGGREAKAAGPGRRRPRRALHRGAAPRRVPADGGEVRLLIEKTYQDREELPRGSGGGRLHALPRHQAQRGGAAPGYELVSCNVPPRSATEPTAASW
jgi:hypothetical protein